MSLDHVDQNTLPPSQDPEATAGIVNPPNTFWGILKSLGPGLIIAGSIVGSGELIGTTKAGAQAGIVLLWLIIIGCLIKVFVQVELGRYALSEGESTLAALDRLPGPRWRVHALVWYWCIMVLAGFGQLGGIVGGVGQSLAITFPVTGDYLTAIRTPSHSDLQKFIDWEDDAVAGGQKLAALSPAERERIDNNREWMREQLNALGAPGEARLAEVRAGTKTKDPITLDDRLWAAVIAVMTSLLLGVGRYRVIQDFSTILVVVFTFVTIGNVFALQTTADWHIPASEFLEGLKFRLPQGKEAIATALAVFGIIGVGASELIAYPYWCLEKGYARFAGRRSPDAAWAVRAKGWIRVMIIDALVSMVVYTIATLAFYLMGVAVLHNAGRDPEGMRMVTTLAFAYEPVFGAHAKWLFLLGAVAVLYSTFLVANASNSRMVLDALKLFGVVDRYQQSAHDKWLTRLSMALPLVCLAIFIAGGDPITLVLFSGMMQALMLPLLAAAALYFRYTQTDSRLRPSPLWDLCLILSALGMLVAGLWGANVNIEKFARQFANWFAT
ncbi:MAG: Nramp family divalent metal transporter [Planctomycetaceae bacterium]